MDATRDPSKDTNNNNNTPTPKPATPPKKPQKEAKKVKAVNLDKNDKIGLSRVNRCNNPKCGKTQEQDPELQLVVCTGCKVARYCNAECQRADRIQHRKECVSKEMMLPPSAVMKRANFTWERKPRPVRYKMIPARENQQAAFTKSCLSS